MNPLRDSRIDHSINLSVQPLQITYNSYTVQQVIDMFKLSEQLQLQNTSSLAIATIDQLRTQTRAGLQHVIDDRKLMDINIVIHSPIIMLPENGVFGDSGKVLVVNFGSLSVTSDMKYHVPDVMVRVIVDVKLELVCVLLYRKHLLKNWKKLFMITLM